MNAASASVPAGARDRVDRVDLVDAPIAVDELIEWATLPDCGAVVSFLGVVRDHAEGRAGVTAMTYEAYREPAIERLAEIAAEARRRVPAASRIAIVHRLGEIALSEASVAVVVSSPHRAAAFEAGRYCIDTLKQTVPIWKKEHWTGGPDAHAGSDWALGAHEIRPVVDVPSSVGD